MKKKILIIITFFASTVILGQETISIDSMHSKTKPFNVFTGDYYTPNNIETSNNKENVFKSANFNPDCSSDFWTINSFGEIQQWSLINGSITGGAIILTGGGSGLAYCGNPNSPTFYCSKYPSTGIMYYDSINNWVNIPTSIPVANNGGHGDDQFYIGVAGGGSKILYLFDGINLTIIDSLSSEYFSAFDLAVDTLGRAWVFKGNAVTSTTELNVYNNAGLISSYNITFNSMGTYGSFFLNDTLYIGMSTFGTNPNSITPIIITGSSAQLGTPIPFPYNNYYDMASCQYSGSPTVSIPEISISDAMIFPNPTIGAITINLGEVKQDVKTTLTNSLGQVILSKNFTSTNFIKLNIDAPKGIYFLQLECNGEDITKKIIKE
tara:strand:- start:2461 stop:3597 length:1137 start_codon:yes stop_codon:yes gene_type:complete